jgi:hypothetical protein
LYLIHGSWIIKDGDVEGCWDDMIKVKNAGLAKYVSAFALFHSVFYVLPSQEHRREQLQP